MLSSACSAVVDDNCSVCDRVVFDWFGDRDLFVSIFMLFTCYSD